MGVIALYQGLYLDMQETVEEVWSCLLLVSLLNLTPTNVTAGFVA